MYKILRRGSGRVFVLCIVVLSLLLCLYYVSQVQAPSSGHPAILNEELRYDRSLTSATPDYSESPDAQVSLATCPIIVPRNTDIDAQQEFGKFDFQSIHKPVNTKAPLDHRYVSAESCNYTRRCTNSRRTAGALGLVFASSAPTCNKPNPLIEPPPECFCRRLSIREDYNTRVTVDERRWRQVNAGRMPLVRQAGKYQLASLTRNLTGRQC
ncbi:hypothetical protein ALC62_14548 [Cyphomyrmex costatus]|uniref:Uncharacterized protein n=1 Tax=Cyphomyrmex costatus TaxID=456900 RepID=A0A195C453_9HYME|nr:hypothetical protein ALC62_14548 [Cyphomyrmex costatus]